MNAVADLQWSRYPGGYQWRSGKNLKVPVRYHVLTVGLKDFSYESEEYSVPSGLFLKFASTRPTKDEIKKFADQYGLLFESTTAVLDQPLRKSAGQLILPDGGAAYGELQSVWRSEIEAMRSAASIWQAVYEAEKGNRERLEKIVAWTKTLGPQATIRPNVADSPWVMTAAPPRRKAAKGLSAAKDNELSSDEISLVVLARRLYRNRSLDGFSAGDSLTAAKHYLRELVSGRMRGRVSPELRWDYKANRPHSLVLQFVPTDLLGAMWLQLAEALNGGKGYRQCRGCKNWILISREDAGNRSSRQTCSNACRMKVYGERKDEARRLRDAGLSPAQVAKNLGTNVGTIEGWLRHKT